MPTPRRRAARLALALALAAAAAATAAATARAAGPAAPPRPGAAPALAVVVLRAPSLADRVAARGGPTSEAEQRAWSAAAFHAQERLLARAAAAGSPLVPVARLTRALDALVVRVTAAQALALEADPDVAGVHPLRTLVALPPPQGRVRRLPDALDGHGVTVTAIGPGATAAALAREVQRRAPGAAVTALAVDGAPAAATATAAPTSASLLAALELALDPSGDGDCHDAARVVALGLADPGAALYPGSPVARALRGATALGAVVVAPAAAPAAASLVAARPGLGAAAVEALLRQAAAGSPPGVPDLAAALAAEVALEPAAGGAAGALLRNVSTRPLSIAVAGEGGVRARPAAVALAVGATRRVTLAAPAAEAAAPAAAPGSVRPAVALTVALGAAQRAPVLPPSPATLTAALEPAAARPSDARPARLRLTVNGGGGAARVEVRLLHAGRTLGALAVLRELAPGSYVLALTGRGADGARLPAGAYVLEVELAGASLAGGGGAGGSGVVAAALGGAAPGADASRKVAWAIRS